MAADSGRLDHQQSSTETAWVGSDGRDTFSSVATCEYRLGGVGNVEQIDCPDRGFLGMSVRLFDLAASRWSIYWASSDVGQSS
ncbi:MAG: hypothetical protein LH616_04370 [Ilumatobacteraceae bacterium]|nr:hypothetical protein [Ilumatobacteraceae bacterium]